MIYQYKCSECGQGVKIQAPWRKDFPIRCNPCDRRIASQAIDSITMKAEAAVVDAAEPTPNPNPLKVKTRADLMGFIRAEAAATSCLAKTEKDDCEAAYPQKVELWCLTCRSRCLVKMDETEIERKKSTRIPLVAVETPETPPSSSAPEPAAPASEEKSTGS